VENNHIVYAAFDVDGNCLYVGEGKPDRYKHITSGTSHVYEANRWHFSNKKVRVDILHEGLSKAEAVSLEKAEIERLKPVWNKSDCNAAFRLEMYNFVTKEIKEFCKSSKRYWNRRDHWITIARDICRMMSSQGYTTITKGQKWCSVDKPVGMMSHLADDSGKYYHVLKAVFDVWVEGNIYHFKLKNWTPSGDTEIT
jgi:hypothetical protein